MKNASKNSEYTDNVNVNYHRISEIINSHIDKKGYVTNEDLKEAFWSGLWDKAKEYKNKGISDNDIGKIQAIQQKFDNIGLTDKLTDKEFDNLKKILNQMIGIHQRNAS